MCIILFIMCIIDDFHKRFPRDSQEIPKGFPRDSQKAKYSQNIPKRSMRTHRQ